MMLVAALLLTVTPPGDDAALVADRAPTERAVVLLWLGLAYAGFGDQAAARRAFGDAIRLDPSIAPPIEISPKVLDEIEGVRGQVEAERASAPAPPRPTSS